MNHHFRSYSEHQPAAQPHQPLSNSNSIIKIHSDSQQSLDRLFNPVQTAIPLRNRQLPESFFNPSFKAAASSDNNDATNNNNNINGNANHHQNHHHHHHQNQVHSRSMSFDQRPIGRNNFHIRTTSTLAPMPILAANSNHSSHQSSNEFSSYTNTNSSSANGCYSSSNSMDDIMSTNCEMTTTTTAAATATTTNNNNNVQPPIQHAISSTQQVVSQPQAYMNYGSIQQHPPAQQTMQSLQHHNHNQNHHHNHNHHHHHQQQQHNHQAQPIYHQQSMQPVPPQPQHAQLVSTATVYGAQHNASNNNDNQHLSHQCPNHLVSVNGGVHSRSMSFDTQHQPMARMKQEPNFHMRTQSTVLTPIPNSNSSTHSSHQASHEFLNYSNQATHGTTNRWPSSGYSTDDPTSSAGWIPGQPQQVHAQPVQQSMQTQSLQHQHSLQMSQQLSQAPQQLFYEV